MNFQKRSGIKTLLLCGAMTLAGSSVMAQDTLRIGAINPYSGPMALYGDEMTRGYQLAIDERNAKGGLLKRKVELLKGDASTPQQGIAAVVNRFARHPHHKPEEPAATLRVPFHGVVRGRNSMDFHSAHDQGLPGIHLHQTARHLPETIQHQGPVRPGYHQFGGGIGSEKRAQGVSIQMVGVVVRTGDDIDPGQPFRRDHAFGEARMRFVGGGVFPGQRIR